MRAHLTGDEYGRTNGMAALRNTVLAAMLSLPMLPALAGALHAHDHAHAAPNGGQLKQIGAYEAELVVKGSEMSLHLVDEQERKVDAQAFSASAVVLAKGNEQKTIALTPSGGNRLSGRMDFPLDGKVRATVTLQTPSGEAGKGRYSLDAGR
ncbi:hypothetical protein [Methylobacterium planeticum]|uniref:Copper chaperone PCu(A)C n=1 Tax=Methylobacterium planeticum TaxID=2615211 RepID=A0A6N6MLR7_9HYPH|nr:hypothetical protein [Methylobacterium planeticum]KAB1070118.1 hypothetical protein F6X51_23875 [Methylobacterium planeticum]